jgi:hypothetical protein
MAPLAAAGYARVELLLNARASHLPAQPPRSYVDKMKGLGFVVWGVVWADSFPDPDACLGFCMNQQAILGLSGFVINAEDGIEERDLRGEGWSLRFCKGYRDWTRRGLVLNTYIGCGGLNLPAWQNVGKARLFVQTHHEGATFEWSVEGYKDWAKFYGWTKPSMMKPQFGCYRGSDGQLPDINQQVASAKKAGTVGFSAYYAEGSFSVENHLPNLLATARNNNVCY